MDCYIPSVNQTVFNIPIQNLSNYEATSVLDKGRSFGCGIGSRAESNNTGHVSTLGSAARDRLPSSCWPITVLWRAK
jgi:hypothetical protein